MYLYKRGKVEKEHIYIECVCVCLRLSLTVAFNLSTK